MPLINFDDITPRKRPTQAGLINFNAIAGPDMRLLMPKAGAVAPVVRQPTVKQPLAWEERREAQGKELMQMVANKESAWDNFTTMVDTFNNQMAKNALGTSAPVEGGIAGNRWVDLGASMLTVVAGAEAAVSVLRAVAYSAWLLKQQKSAAFNAKWSGPVVEGWVTGEGTPVVQTVASKNNIPVETARTVVSYVLQNGDTNITPALQAASSLAKATTPQQLQALLPTAVTAMQSANILKSVPAIPLGGKVQPTAQVIAAEGKVAEPQVVTTPTISTDKYEVSHPLPERPNSTAKKHLSLKADADISAFIEKHAALTEKPEAVMDKTVPAINLQKSGSVDITDRVDLASVQVKYPTATTVVLDPKRRTVMFLHDTTPLEAIAIDRPQLKAWYGIDGEKILSEITQPVQPADQPVAPVTTTKQPWEMTLRDVLSRGVQWDVPESVDAAARNVAEREVKKMDAYKREHKKDLEYKKMGIMRGWGGFASDGPSDVTEMARVFNDVFTKEVHREAVRGALSEGKPVPSEVLADYPDLVRPLKSGGKLEISNGEQAIHTTPSPSPSPAPSPAVTATAQTVVPTVSLPKDLKFGGWQEKTGKVGYHGEEVPVSYRTSTKEVALTVYKPNGSSRPIPSDNIVYDEETGGRYTEAARAIEIKGVPYQTVLIQRQSYFHDGSKSGKPWYCIADANTGLTFGKTRESVPSAVAEAVRGVERAKNNGTDPGKVLADAAAKIGKRNTEIAYAGTKPSPTFPAVTQATPASATVQNTASPQGLNTTAPTVVPAPKEVLHKVGFMPGSTADVNAVIKSGHLISKTGLIFVWPASVEPMWRGMPEYDDMVRVVIDGNPKLLQVASRHALIDTLGLRGNTDTPAVAKQVADKLRGLGYQGYETQDYHEIGLLSDVPNRVLGLAKNTKANQSPASAVTQAISQGLNRSGFQTDTTSDYVMDVSPQSMAAQADRQLNGSREGYVTLNTLNPIHWVNELVKNDPLAKGLDKIGLYTLLYGKEEMAAIRAGRGNPSLFAMRPVPAVVKRNFIWGYGFSPDTLDEMKDVRVRARTMYGKLAELEDQTIKQTKDQFIEMLHSIASGNVPATTGQATTPAQELGRKWADLENSMAYNLIHDGQLDPAIFTRLGGRYLPAPNDSMGEILRPLEEAEHIRPSLKFLREQKMTPAEILAYAADNWEKYRAFFFQRMRSEIRAAEKGGVFNAIAADPKSGIMPPELAPKKGYVEVDDAMNAFGLKGAAVPQWVADFIHNEFIDVQVAQQLQGYSELLGWYKFLKVGANIPTFIRNVVSQLTVQMLEGNVGPLDLEHYLIKPMGVLLGMDKAGKQELVAMGLWDNNIAREMEGLQFTPEEKALWNTGDRTVAITAFVNRIKNFRSRWSSVYGLADAYTKAATYFANKEQYGARGARNIAFLTSGDYTSRPPIVNFLSRGTRKGKVNPLMFLISNPFAFYRTVVEPQRVGYDLVHHPSLVVGAVAAAYFVIKGVAKRVAKEYDISEEQAAELITELQNYEWLKGRAVLPISGEQAIDLTDLIPMVSYLTTFQQELASHEDLFREIFKWGGLLFGSNNPNFVLNIIATWVTGNDFAAEWRYGRTYRVGDTTWAKLKWTAKQLLPSWITRTLENTKTGNFSITDIIGSYIATASDEDKINFYNSLRKNPQYDAKELNRIYNALFKGTSLTGK